MYKINDFAKIFNVTTATLRFYEKKNIFKPAYKDNLTGYRYYTNDQLILFSKIQDLKNMGFSLEDISDFLNGTIDLDNLEKIVEDKLKTLQLSRQFIKLHKTKKDNVFYTRKRNAFYCATLSFENEELPIIEKANKKFFLDIIKAGFSIDPKNHCFIQFKCEPPTKISQKVSVDVCYPIIYSVSFIKKNNITKEAIESLHIQHYPETNYIFAKLQGLPSKHPIFYNGLLNYIKENNIKISGYPIEVYINYSLNSEDILSDISEIGLPLEDINFNLDITE